MQTVADKRHWKVTSHIRFLYWANDWDKVLWLQPYIHYNFVAISCKHFVHLPRTQCQCNLCDMQENPMRKTKDWEIQLCRVQLSFRWPHTIVITFLSKNQFLFIWGWSYSENLGLRSSEVRETITLPPFQLYCCRLNSLIGKFLEEDIPYIWLLKT